MKWLFIYRRDIVVCNVYYFFIFWHFIISFKYEFDADAERMIVYARNVKKYLCLCLKKCMARYLFRREELSIFVGYDQLN